MQQTVITVALGALFVSLNNDISVYSTVKNDFRNFDNLKSNKKFGISTKSNNNVLQDNLEFNSRNIGHLNHSGKLILSKYRFKNTKLKLFNITRESNRNFRVNDTLSASNQPPIFKTANETASPRSDAREEAIGEEMFFSDNETKFSVNRWNDFQSGNYSNFSSYQELVNFLQEYLQELISPDVERISRQARGKKKKAKKFLLPMLIGALLVKSLILPVLLKGLAILSSKAVVLSMISLLIASITGFARRARYSEQIQATPDKTEVQVIHVPVKHHGGYKRYVDETAASEEYVQHHDFHDRNDPYYRSNVIANRYS